MDEFKDGHISKLDAYEVLSDYYHHRTEAQHEALREALSRVPAIDVAPVVYGKWVYKPLDKFRKYQVRCSNCDMAFIGNYDAYDEPDDFNYCPNCGARMDGDEDV